MNKVIYLLSVLLLAGCARSPVVRLTSTNDMDGFYAYLNEKPYFSLITDGDVNGGVTVYAHISAKYKGSIIKSDDTESVPFSTIGQKITIGNKDYDFEDGRLILVSTRTNPFKVEQFKVSEEDKINALLATDNRMVRFFE